MINRLRMRLIFVSMLSLLIVLAVILGLSNIINYNSTVKDADSVLEILSRTDGRFPDVPEDMPWQSAGDRYRSPELPFEIRFFSATVDGEGEIVSSNTDKIAAVDSDLLTGYIHKAEQTGDDKGFVGDYRFLRYAKEETSIFIFLDCGRQLAVFHHGIRTMLIVSGLGFIAVFILIYLLSWRIVQPFIRNYDNQRRFITDAGHELKTPITILDADAELLGLEVGESEWLSDILQQTQRLADLTHDLIDLSCLEENGTPEMIEFPASDILLETVSSFQAVALSAGKQLDIRIQPGISMIGNEKNICRLTTILMDNALKYVDQGGRIVFSVEQKGRYVCICCENTVETISKETLRNMFERFYRADSARRQQKRGGYGIGLSIARAIVEAHKGKISASRSTEHMVVITAMIPAKLKNPEQTVRE